MSLRQSACLGKFRFETFDEAKRVAAAARRRKNAMRQKAYRCQVCRGFHVGTDKVKLAQRQGRVG